jgi:hypothetical protein
MDLRLLVPVTDAARVQEAPNTRAWPPDLAAQALRQPQIAAAWEGRDWSLLMQQARSAGLLARALDGLAGPEEPEGRTSLPAGVQAHHEAAQRLCRAQAAEIHREVRYIAAALAELKAPVVLLKGAAYVMAGLPAANGRIFSDIDFMVPKSHLAQAEAMLMAHGWMTTHHSAYDQRYYRQWMHELPPMQHVARGTTIDVHHTILPETARLHPPAHKLFEAAVPLAGWPGLFVLSPADMLLHSSTHLFMNDDMTHALRDLSDMDLLLTQFAQLPGFWSGLLDRARQMDLSRPLFYALRYIQAVWGRQLPAEVNTRLKDFSPPNALLPLMDGIWLRALRSPHASATPALKGAALAALYLRGHWLRMPPALLARHLAIKALRLHKAGEATKPPQDG